MVLESTQSTTIPPKTRSAKESDPKSPSTTRPAQNPDKTYHTKQSKATKPELTKITKTTPKQPSKQAGGTLYEKVVRCRTYEALQRTVIELEILPLPKLPDVTFVSHKRIIDDSALREYMKDRGLFPSTVYGDGNCLPRCASLLAYGKMEMRIITWR